MESVADAPACMGCLCIPEFPMRCEVAGAYACYINYHSIEQFYDILSGFILKATTVDMILCGKVAGAGHTRLCVKGLPKHLTSERLRKHFEDVAEVTDARVCTTSDGASRNFGFIGFRTEKDAQKCLKYFHDTFIDTSKIVCEIARPKGDENLARPWSRYSEGSSANQRLAKKNSSNTVEAASGKAAKTGADAKKKIVSKDHELLERAKTDPKMKAFIDAFKPRTKTKVWENDDVALNDANSIALKEMTQMPVKYVCTKH